MREIININQDGDRVEEIGAEDLGDGPEINLADFSDLTVFTNDGENKRDAEAIEEFSDCGDRLRRLELLQSMSTAKKIECMAQYASSSAAGFLKERLSYYQKIIRNGITQKDKIWSDEEQNFVLSKTDIPAADIERRLVCSDLSRDLFYAVMLGTPEMAAVDMATKAVNRASGAKIYSIVQLFGEDSGADDCSAGHYACLAELYNRCRDQVAKDKQEEPSEKQIENKAIKLMADRLEAAYGYSGVITASGKFGNPLFEEAITAGQLGKEIQRQMTYMRENVEGTPIIFRNISRFIGKSGDNKYTKEKQRLEQEIGFINGNADSENKQRFVAQENKGALKILEKKYQDEIEDLYRWHPKNGNLLLDNLAAKNQGQAVFPGSNFRIGGSGRPKGFDMQKEMLARQRGSQSRLGEINEKFQKIHDGFESEKSRLQNRTPDQLLADLKQRKEVVGGLYEDNKSLAQQAFDLYFAMNGTINNTIDKPFAGVFDWIGGAPFEIIGRAHKMLRQGVTESEIAEYTLTDMIHGVEDINGQDLQKIRAGLEAARRDKRMRAKIKQIAKVGNVLKTAGYKLLFDDLADIAAKDFIGIDKAVKLFDLEQIKHFLDSGLSLETVAEIRKVAQESGYDAPIGEITEIASYPIMQAANAADIFNLGAEDFNFEDLKKLLQKNIGVVIASDVIKSLKKIIVIPKSIK